MADREIDTANDFMFGTTGTEMSPMFLPRITSREQAFRTAAWIEIMGQVLPSETDEEVTYDDVREAILNT